MSTSFSEIIRRTSYYMIFTFSFILVSTSIFAIEVGKVQFVRGAVTAQTCDSLRLLGKDTIINLNDVVTIATGSFAVMELNDGTRMSLRPGSVIEIKEYSEEQGQESVTIHLYKGGLRIISGFISKVNPDAFRITTSVSTIGVSGTELDARLCQEDCETEAKEITAPSKVKPAGNIVGRVAFMRGELNAINAEGSTRKMARGAPVFNNEEYETGVNSYALLVFRDGGRISLRAESNFKVENYQFDENEPEQGNSSLRFIKGGLRALTGRIGDSNPDAYHVDTSVATIGIRGTGFDLVWQGACTGAAECGLVASVWQGRIFSQNNTGTVDIGLNQTARIPEINQPLQFIDIPPQFTIPRPDTEDIDLDDFFSAQTDRGAEPGLFVACYEGHCSLNQDGETTDLGPGESGFAGYSGEETVRLAGIESFQVNDRYLGTVTETIDTLFELQDNLDHGNTSFECVVR